MGIIVTSSRTDGSSNYPQTMLLPSDSKSRGIRHDDPRVTPYSPGVSRLRSAVELASDVEGLRLVLATKLGDHYRVRVRDDRAVVGLWRR